MFVILNEVKNLKDSISYKTQILRLTPQNDIVIQSHNGEGVKVGVKKMSEPNFQYTDNIVRNQE